MRPPARRCGRPGSPVPPPPFGAFIPVAPFLFDTGPAAIWASFALAMISHFGVGAARSFFTGRGVFRSGLDMFLVGLGVAVIGYFVGERIVKLLVRVLSALRRLTPQTFP